MEGEHEEFDQASADSEAQMRATMEKMDEVAPDSAELARDLAAIDTGAPLEAAAKPEAAEPPPAAAAGETTAKPAAGAAAEIKPKVEPAKVPDDDSDLEKHTPGPGTPKRERLKWEALTDRVKQRTAQFKEIREQFETFKAEAAKRPAVGPEIEDKLKRLADLEQREYLFDPEKSAIITREFDGRLKTSGDKIRGLLYGVARAEMPGAKDEEVSAEVAAYIGDKIERRTADEWLADLGARAAAGKLSPAGAERAKAAVHEYFDALDARQAAIAKAPQDRKAWEEKRTAEQAAAQKKMMAEAQDEFEKINTKELPDWAKLRDVPATATPEQKAAIEKGNAYVNETLTPAFKKALEGIWKGGPRDHVRVATEAVRATHFEAEAKRLAAELEATKQQLAAAQGKVAAVKKAGAISRAVSTPAGPARAHEEVDLEASMRKAFESLPE